MPLKASIVLALLSTRMPCKQTVIMATMHDKIIRHVTYDRRTRRTWARSHVYDFEALQPQSLYDQTYIRRWQKS